MTWIIGVVVVAGALYLRVAYLANKAVKVQIEQNQQARARLAKTLKNLEPK